MSMKDIAGFLKTRPDGATGTAIALNLDCGEKSVCESLSRMLARSMVVRDETRRNRSEAVWRLVGFQAEATPSIYRAMETLEAMRATALARLTRKYAEAA